MPSLFHRLFARPRRDRYTRQAELDQLRADFPGCCLGVMHCRSQTCYCNETRASLRFILIRAKRMRAGLNPELYSASDESLS